MGHNAEQRREASYAEAVGAEDQADEEPEVLVPAGADALQPRLDAVEPCLDAGECRFGVADNLLQR